MEDDQRLNTLVHEGDALRFSVYHCKKPENRCKIIKHKCVGGVHFTNKSSYFGWVGTTDSITTTYLTTAVEPPSIDLHQNTNTYCESVYIIHQLRVEYIDISFR